MDQSAVLLYNMRLYDTMEELEGIGGVGEYSTLLGSAIWLKA